MPQLNREERIAAIRAELQRLNWDTTPSRVNGLVVTTDPDCVGPLPAGFVVVADEQCTLVDRSAKVLRVLRAISTGTEYGSGLQELQDASDYQSQRHRELVQILGRITTRDEAGRHFTSLHPRHVIDALEWHKWITLHKPVHPATGLEYDESHWSLEVTPLGQQVVAEDYEEPDETAEESGRICLCIDNDPAGYAVSNPDDEAAVRRIIRMASSGPALEQCDCDSVVEECWAAICELTGWPANHSVTIEHDRNVIHVIGDRLPQPQ